ncbi:hypothetical protein D3C86_1506070 [compost metagenome]
MTDLERRLLNDFQRGFPLTARPFAELARRLNVDEPEVIDALERLQTQGAISRVGPVFAPNRVGASTLAALSVPADRFEAVAELVSAYPQVNHNYAREHPHNLWFVVTAESRERLAEVLAEIAARTGLSVLDLPLEEEFHIDLGFELRWH